MLKVNEKDHKLLALWAADCAEHVLPFFEKTNARDKRPRKAIEACRIWAKTGVFKMKDIRKTSLDAHAAARKAKNDTACFAARAAGQAIATAHVAEHAFGPAYYALKIALATDPANDKLKVVKELTWQTQHLPKHLRKTWKEWQIKRLPKYITSVIQ